MQFHYLPDGPVFDADKVRARWAAAKADYLAGGSGPEVCERHGLRLRSFRYRAKLEGWRRADQPEPEPEPEPAPAAQNDRLVIPDAPSGAIRDRFLYSRTVPARVRPLCGLTWRGRRHLECIE